ncbi:ATP-binding protein, partial [Campylobacter jejuni]|nr:ATP-binding protein [Campylobacter jejuni]
MFYNLFVYIMTSQILILILLQNAFMSLDSLVCVFTKFRGFRLPIHSSTRASFFGGGSKSA